VKFEPISRNKRRISVYPLSEYQPGGQKIEATQAVAAD
jgi:hypothetical protein